MQRLIEQPADEGDVVEGRTRLGRVRYHLSVYQHFSEGGSDPVGPSFVVEGHITPVDHLDLAALHHRRSELALRLADGRVLDFLLASADGYDPIDRTWTPYAEGQLELTRLSFCTCARLKRARVAERVGWSPRRPRWARRQEHSRRWPLHPRLKRRDFLVRGSRVEAAAATPASANTSAARASAAPRGSSCPAGSTRRAHLRDRANTARSDSRPQ